ncbi:hypothetical protein CC78DRAFT_619637 [Lojkania enalia]|uniref:Uncharacterized protein n=1 Tax=Lojkania enalia TaxID=147567 RepID=A0A9P4K1Z9_9PLEO|nr:hypothetical protein CC78DRAFT_619637 [Didymosphaeria enalia]
MDIRRPPARNPNPASRRNIFNAPSRRPNSHLGAQLPSSSMHISAEEADPKDGLVERDSSGNYAIAAPTVSLKAGATRPGGEMDDEAGTSKFLDEVEEAVFQSMEHEYQMIALYGKRNEHWDTAGLMNEIKAALQANLERKVISLEHDRWMFEGDGKSKS